MSAIDDFVSGSLDLGRDVSRFAPAVGATRFSTSTFGKAITVAWGQPRISANSIWAGSSTGPAGFGPGAGTFTFSVSDVAICEGPISAYKRVWNGKDFYQSPAFLPSAPAAGFPNGQLTTFLGDYTQTPKDYVLAFSPIQALAYRGIAYIFTGSLAINSFGQSSQFGSSLPSASFEVATTTQVGSIGSLAKTVTPDFTTDTFSSTAHGFKEFQNIRITSSGTLPAGLIAGQDYLARNVTANTFQLALNGWDVDGNGNALLVNFTSNGTGTITATPFVLDANPKDCITDGLTNVNYGIGFPSAMIGNLTAFSNYCIASGSLGSPALESQEQGNQFIERQLILGFSGAYFSEGVLKIVPYCDTAITGNGVTFTPSNSAAYALVDDDFAPDVSADPVIVSRVPQTLVFNSVRVEFENRLNQYLIEIAEVRDEAAIQQFGYRPKDVITLHEVKEPATAKWVATMALFREQNIRNTYKFRIPDKYLLLEPMDILTLTESSGTPLSNVAVRITEIAEQLDGYLEITAEDFPLGAALGVSYPTQVVNAFNGALNATPGSVNPPVMFVGPYSLTAGRLELWAGISGGAKFGGCDIYVSTNNADYTLAGTFAGKAITGVITTDFPQVTDPDQTSNLGVNLSESSGTLASTTQAESDKFNSLCYVAGTPGELISFVNAGAGSPNQYTLTNMRRGVYGTAPTFAKTGAQFLYIGPNTSGIFRLPFPAEFNGRTVFLKFLAFNTFGGGKQSLSDVSPYQFTLSQQFTGLPPMPPISGLELFGLGLSTLFPGRDAKFGWRQASSLNSFDIGSEPFGGNSGGLDPFFKDYEVRMLSAPNGSILRTEHTLDPFYTYTYEKNFDDNLGVPLRSFAINVFARGDQGQLSAMPAVLAVSNPAPAVPTGITTSVGPNSVNIACTLPTDTDVQGLLIWMSTSTGFTPGPGNLVYQGPDSQVNLNGLSTLTQYFFRIAAFDVFGTAGVNISSEFSATTIFTIGGIQVVTSLPAAGIVGRVVYLTTDGKLYRDNGSAWVKTTDGADILANSITAASMSVAQLSAITADLGSITAGSIRGANINSTAYTTKGSFLTSATTGGDTTVNVGNTADFPTSGSGQFIDTTNDRDAFAWTGKTGTTLTGCSGVLAHNNGCTVIPLLKCVVVDDAVNEMRLFADRGDGVIEELFSVGIVPGPAADNVTLTLGSAGMTNMAMWVQGARPIKALVDFINGGGGAAVEGENTGSGPGMLASSAAGTGPAISLVNGSTKGAMLIGDSGSYPTNPAGHQMTMVNGRLHYSDGSHWLPLTMPYFESSEQTIVNNTDSTVAHGLTDGTGAGRLPKTVLAVMRCKTAEFGYAVGEEVPLGPIGFDTVSFSGLTLYMNTTNIGFVQSNHSPLFARRDAGQVGNAQLATPANWKIVIYAS